MFDSIITALYLAIPLVFSGSFHMLVVSKNWFPGLATPIHQVAFGANKTWRGVVVMPLATIPGVYLALLVEPFLLGHVTTSLTEATPWILGIALGIGYVIPELPNSYVKRRLNIKPGQQPDKNAFWFGLMDQADSAIGCAVVYWLMLQPALDVMIWIVVLGPLLHLIANLSLYSAGLRKQPF